ncbi:hypothetical protein CONPUDRAFT_168894 [Coniophora puteana RWD-64-598 SS2]|uniref:Uncharacterized protein n=1 Tax=Coniophora puteana (strain RWD-64-598) TaxID=741705 RepID=A0A5M3MBS0_CONPW|nr:uncharacterized protein CONPUDRAFT_168894 [Coniophora puteana RWD-64-598 SS2]EIW76334.1 hypothetical protein CONPUDRAFT_168894 [Coniophora puteana RWD-64-598 SS2]
MPVIPTILEGAAHSTSNPTVELPLADSDFTLDASGVAGFFGGDVAVSAMATVHVYRGRRWLGWYNTPGSYEIGKRYGILANSRVWDGIFPGANVEPAELFGLNNLKGPTYRGAKSGSVIDQTGHIAALFVDECKDHKPKEIDGRQSAPVGVTVVKLNPVEKEMYPTLLRTYSGILALLPILVSVGACVGCALVADWITFVMILYGIFTSGIACFVIGSGKLKYTHPEPAPGAPSGDGILTASNGEIIVLKGAEADVNAVTRGQFCLSFYGEPKYSMIGWAGLLLTVQFVAQLLLIPQGTLFGQILFIGSLAVSWMYNSYLSSLDSMLIQRKILMDSILRHPRMRKYSLGTRTTMAVFVMLILEPVEPLKFLNELIPNDTLVWRVFKQAVVDRMQSKEGFGFDAEVDAVILGKDLNDQEKELLLTLFKDAESGYEGWLQHSASFHSEAEKKSV